MAPKLTEKQRRFVAAFLGPAMGNGTKAAQLAGVPRQSASVMAWKWLRKVQVQRALVQRQEKRESAEIAAADERDKVLTEMLRDKLLPAKERQRAIDLLNRCEGRYTMRHILEAHHTIEDLVMASRREGAK